MHDKFVNIAIQLHYTWVKKERVHVAKILNMNDIIVHDVIQLLSVVLQRKVCVLRHTV